MFFSSSSITPICDVLMSYVHSVKYKFKKQQYAKRFFLNATDDSSAGLSLDTNGFMLCMSNFLLGIFVERLLKQSVSSQKI